MNIQFIDTPSAQLQLLPLTYTRPMATLRVGIFKIYEKWCHDLGIEKAYFRTVSYLQPLFPAYMKSKPAFFILGNILPTQALMQKIRYLHSDEAIVCKDKLIAGYYGRGEPFEIGDRKRIEIDEVNSIEYTWDIFIQNGREIFHDYYRLSNKRNSDVIKDRNTVRYGDSIFIEPEVVLKSVVLNAENGPIYIGKGCRIEENTVIKGPFAICEYGNTRAGAILRENTTIGPYSTVGGEISNSVILGFSNKAHHGFLGNAVIGEWCNFGAGTSNSNLKNNYSTVKMWNFPSKKFIDTGLSFCGLVMGDYSRCSINTMFNTGSTVGVLTNIFGSGFFDKFVPSFSWGSASGFTTYQIGKAIETIHKVMNRKNMDLTDNHKNMLLNLFEMRNSDQLFYQ